MSGKSIASLQGIEHFTALVSLDAGNNLLTTLDLGANTKLQHLFCDTNRLTSLNVTACPELVELNCESIRLQTLDLSGNPALDVRNNLELAFIETFDNQLTDFDGSMLKKLKFLHIDYNRLTTLDMSGNPALEGNGFVAANNQLDTLVLPDIPGFQVEAEVFYEQNPRTGYDRVEWYLDPDFTRPAAADGVLEATGQTLYARWLPNPYTVYYFANGGGGTMAPQPAVYGSEFALTPCAFARTGYTFAGWSTYSDGVGGRSYADGQLVQNLAGENSSRTAAYLYAQWQANKYTVSYNANGGQGDLPATDALTARTSRCPTPASPAPTTCCWVGQGSPARPSRTISLARPCGTSPPRRTAP